MLRKSVRILLFSLLALIVGTIGGYMWLETSLPKIEGNVRVSGLSEEVRVRRNANGVPTIVAHSMPDAWFALGFVHAQDRLWQMEGMRRFALGTLSEVIGAETLQTDVAQRRLGFGRLAKAQYKLLDPVTKRALETYADGVNAYLATRTGALPLEFLMLGYEPKPWEPFHGLLWGRLMAYQLSARWREDLVREALIEQGIELEKLREIWPAISGIHVTGNVVPEIPYSPFEPPRGASNAWAVGPSKSKSGASLLAGDPHLGLSIPGTWYLARMMAGGQIIEGATAPGVPFVILGRNEDVAWSFTSSEADLQDVIRVTTSDITRNEPEEIRIKGGESYTFRLFESHGSPVVSGDLLDGKGDTGLVLAATALHSADHTITAFRELNEATDIERALEALEKFHAPLMNVIIADSVRIARAHAGVIPERSKQSGRLPIQGHMRRSGVVNVHGVVTPLVDPAVGFVANANEATPELKKATGIVGDWSEAVRAQRLKEMLSKENNLEMSHMMAFQRDVVDISAEIWKDRVSIEDPESEPAHAWALFQDWDGAMDRELPQPLIYAAWMAELQSQMFADELGPLFPQIKLPGPPKMLQLIDRGSAWCRNVKQPEADATCAELPSRAFVSAINKVVSIAGDEPDKWRWEDVHDAVFVHALLGRLPGIGDIFNRYIPTSGGDRTLNRGASPRASGANSLFPHVHGAGFRAVHELSERPSRYMIAVGQSGNPLSDNYDDLLENWRDGRYIGFDAPIVARLSLTPQ